MRKIPTVWYPMPGWRRSCSPPGTHFAPVLCTSLYCLSLFCIWLTLATTCPVSSLFILTGSVCVPFAFCSLQLMVKFFRSSHFDCESDRYNENSAEVSLVWLLLCMPVASWEKICTVDDTIEVSIRMSELKSLVVFFSRQIFFEESMGVTISEGEWHFLFPDLRLWLCNPETTKVSSSAFGKIEASPPEKWNYGW